MSLFSQMKAAMSAKEKEKKEESSPPVQEKITPMQEEKKERKIRKGSKSEKIHLLETLSPREREVFGLLIEGHTLRQTAEILGLSYPTINTHQTKLYKKLGVNSRAELIILYRDLAGAISKP